MCVRLLRVCFRRWFIFCVSTRSLTRGMQGTGDYRDIGYGKGENTSINFPLRDGMDDESYRTVFRPVIGRIMEKFQPGAIVLQVRGRGGRRGG